MAQLERFHAAQDAPGSGFDAALQEIRTGSKTGHWIWYVFPQLQGLGASAMSHAYALADAVEAAGYLRDPELRARLLTITAAVAGQLTTRGRPLRTLMGSDVDARKLVSSLTLFEAVAAALHREDGHDDYAAIARAAGEVLTAAAAEGYARCAYTLAQLTSARS
jgi:uncharacterized protein (DUF1810 family)